MRKRDPESLKIDYISCSGKDLRNIISNNLVSIVSLGYGTLDDEECVMYELKTVLMGFSFE